MHNPLVATPRSTPARRKQRGTYDRATVNVILDEALVCHVGFVHDGKPVVLPTAYVRVGDHVYLHGAPGNRMFNTLADGVDACVTVTLVDGLVLAAVAGHHSLNYRSVVLFGQGRRVTDEAELKHSLSAIVETLLQGRGRETIGVSADDLKTTLVVAFPIDEGSAKVRVGPPADDPETPRGFVGVIPVRQAVSRARVAKVSAKAIPHLSQLSPMADPDLPEVLSVLGEAFGWGEPGEVPGALRIARYRSVYPDGWFALRAQRDAESAPEIAAVGGGVVFGDTAYLGLIGTRPAFQRRGYARIITERLCRWADARGATRVLLDASAAGEPVYTALGFVPEGTTEIFQRTHEVALVASSRVRRATADDHARIIVQDTGAYSRERAALIGACLADGTAFVHEAGGFCIAQAGHIGPLVAPHADAARELLAAALAASFVRAPEVYTRHPETANLLLACGFERVRTCTHMRKGGAPLGAQPLLWAQQSLATG
jgi:uncharacterized protein